MNKKYTSVALSLMMALGLAACGTTQTADTPETPQDVLAKAEENMADLKSMRYDMTMDMEFAVEDQAIPVMTTAQADYIADPITMKMDLSMDMGELGSMSTVSYVTSEDGKYQVCTGIDDGAGNLTWTRQDMGDLSALEQYNAKATFDLYLDSAENFTEAGTETISGVETTRYDGIITKDSMNKVLDASGMLDQLSALGMGDMADLLTDLDDLPLSIWIDKETYLPMQYEMDMTAMMQSMMTKLMADQEGAEDVNMTVNKVLVSMTMKDINSVDAIEIPQEALDAPVDADAAS